MRWFKHFCDTQNSESLDALIERFGFAGYGRWFRILEAIGSKMDGSDRCHLELSVRRWCEILRLRPAQLREFCEATQQIMNKNCADNAKVVLEVCSDTARFTVPNLLKIRDEYTSRIGSESGETTPQRQSKRESKSKEEDKNPPTPQKEPKLIPREVEAVIKIWNATEGTRWPKVNEPAKWLINRILALQKEADFDLNIIITEAKKSETLLGAGWFNLGWLLKLDEKQNVFNYRKVLRGDYVNHTAGGGTKPNIPGMCTTRESKDW